MGISELLNIFLGGLSVILVLLLFVRRKSRKVTPMGNILEDSLRDERQKSTIILNAIEDGVILADKDYNIQLFNPGAASITGWPANEAQGLNFRSVIKLVDEKGESYSNLQDPIARITRDRRTIRDNTAILVTKSNKQVPLSLSVSPLFDQFQNLTGLVAIIRDVTQERQEEKQRSDFISTASHEMRTPVAAIEGYLALALNDKVSTVDSRARSYLEKAHDSTQHLGRLFQDLLTSAKAEDGRLTSHPTIVELGAYLEKLSGDLRFAADKKGLSLEYTIGSSQTIDATGKNPVGQKVVRPLYYVTIDQDRLGEVVTNLVDNAIKYTNEGAITVGLSGDNQVAQIYVKDSGVGIPAEDIPHLFQKFYRIDNSATRTIGGTGLGLFICRKIVELYQGKIWVESQLGKGSTFFINLPRLSTEQANQALNNPSSQTIIKPDVALNSPMIQ